MSRVTAPKKTINFCSVAKRLRVGIPSAPISGEFMGSDYAQIAAAIQAPSCEGGKALRGDWYCAKNGSCRLDITKRPGTSRAAHLHAWFAARGRDARTADPAALRRAVGKGTHVSSALSHRRAIVSV